MHFLEENSSTTYLTHEIVLYNALYDVIKEYFKTESKPMTLIIFNKNLIINTLFSFIKLILKCNIGS